MRIHVIVIGMALILTACGDGGGIPLNASDEVPLATDVTGQNGDSANSIVEETGDPSVAPSVEPIELEPEVEVDPADKPIAPSTLPQISTTVPSSGFVPVGEVPADLIASIIADAESRSVANAASIVVLRAQAVTWSDGSLGCPEPGMMYTQALVNGYWVVLDAGGKTLDYRAGSGGGFRFCPFGGSEPTAPVDH